MGGPGPGHCGIEVAEALAGRGVDAGVIDIYRIKPLNVELLLNTARKTGRILTIEESFVSSGIGNIISQVITSREENIRLKCLGVPDRFFSPGGDRRNLHRLCGLDAETVTRTALDWLK